MQPRLDLRLSQRLIMTPQLQQAIKLLQLSRLELQQALTQQLEENPLLEEGSQELEDVETEVGASDEAVDTGTVKQEEEDGAGGAGGDESSREELTGAWEEYFDDDRRWGDVEAPRTGRDELPSLEQTMTKIASLNVLKVIQGFDPVGVAARDLPECLLAQIEHLGLGGSLVEAIIRHHLADLEHKRYPAIAKALGVPMDAVLHALKIIEGLEPKPGRPFFASDNHPIIPDVYVFKSDGQWVVRLNDDGMPRFRINSYYRRFLAGKRDPSDATRAFLDEKLRSAQWLIRSIDQRNKTIVRVVESIVKTQEPFFEHGIQYLKPMVLRDVAEDVSMHESTISRVTSNKYLHCTQGIFELMSYR